MPSTLGAPLPRVSPLSLALAAALALAPATPEAADFLVLDPVDAVDAVPGDGACAALGGGCTLRAAVMEANALPGPDRIFVTEGHWFLDLVVHRPDLPLYDDAAKVGLGLWNFPVPAFLLEAGLLFGGIFVYARSADPFYARKRTRMLIFGAVMAVGQFAIFFGPPPPSTTALGITALSSYLVYAAAARWLEGRV